MRYTFILGPMVLASCLTMPNIGHCNPIYVGSSYGSSNSGSGPVTINVPPGTANGDVMLAYIATQTGNGAWITAPPGWVQVMKTFNAIQGGQLFWHSANNEPASYTWKGTSYPQGTIRTYRNVNTTAPIGSSAGCGTTNGTSCQIPALNEKAVGGEWYVGFWDFNIAPSMISGPSDLGNATRNLTQRSMFAGDKTLTASAAPPAQAATVSGAASYFDGIGVTLEPASGGGGGGGGVTASSANDFLNSMSVIIPSGSLGNQKAVNVVNNIGYRIVKAATFESGLTVAQIQGFLNATHTKTIWSMGSSFGYPPYPQSISQIITGAKVLASAGQLLGFEGPNEPDNWGVMYNGVAGGGPPPTSWVPVAQLQRDFYAAIKADPVLKNYPVASISHNGAEHDDVGLQCLVLNSTCAGASSVTLMPANTVFADQAGMHNYAIQNGGTYTPTDNQAWNVADPAVVYANSGESFPTDYGVTWAHGYPGYSSAQLPAVTRITTETGWSMADATSNAIGAKILLSVYLDQFKRGYTFTVIFTLQDQPGDSFGIVNSDYSYKPAATYIQNLFAILADNAAVSATPGTLNYSIASEPATMHDMLLQKSTGAFELAVWDEQCPAQSTAGANCTQPVPTQNVTVNLGGTHATVNVYDPTVGTAAVQVHSNVSSVPLALTDHPMIIEIVN